MFADPASMIDAAQKAAGEGDFPAAERLLRDAARMQEATLGASHPDLATTLNNLAFVCERTDKFDEAERGYRRAHAIAVASLSPGHPFIATSLKNLLDFCATRGIPIWTPPASPVDEELPPLDSGDEPSEAAIQDEVPETAAVSGLTATVSRRLTPRTIAVAAVAVAAIVLVTFARQGQRATDTPRPLPQERPAPSQSEAPSRSEAASPSQSPPAPPPTTIPARPRETQPAVAREQRPDTAKASPTVLNAQLCRALERRGSPDWQCAPVNGDLQPGTYIFYTRLLTNADTTVEHRWYRAGRVHQVIRLRVSASSGGGYRTFSSNTVSPERAGEWKVELRAAGGSLLQEERFVVR